ncbi:MAG: Radical domain protein [Myxococcales bacterium]|nr:Radical domain protein [Myxococcales bacterium]
MKLYEIYTSIQGETQYAGLPCTLVRFAACDLRCTYCDTEYAFTGGQEVAVETIVRDVEARGARLVLLTGGEPMLQRDLPELAALLLAGGFEVMIETGGHRDLSTLPAGVVKIVDVKTPGSGESHKMFWANLERLVARDAVKFVVTSEADYRWSLDVIREHRLESRCNVLLSPSFGQVEPKELVDWMLRDRVQARLNLQIHKIVWPPDQRGV